MPTDERNLRDASAAAYSAATVLGSGLRATVEALGPEAAQRVRAANLGSMRGVHEVETNVVYGLARNPASAAVSPG